jgi:hypothetical protein
MLVNPDQPPETIRDKPQRTTAEPQKTPAYQSISARGKSQLVRVRLFDADAIAVMDWEC